MCWDATISLQTFALAVFGVGLGWTSGTLPASFAVFMMSFSSMQLLEAGLWKKLADPAWNRALSMAGLALVMSQPVFSTLTVPPGPLRTGLLAAYTAYLAVYATLFLPKTQFLTRVAPNGHLRWEWLRPPLAFILAWIAFLLVPMWVRPLYKNRAGFWFTLAAAMASLALYYRDGTWGSVWCWVSNVAALFIIVDVLFVRNACRFFPGRAPACGKI